MQILESLKCDLIAPFPLNQLPRMVKWTHQYKTFLTYDGGPKTDEELMQYLIDLLQRSQSFGIIDRLNLSGINHEAPIVGAIVFEPSGPYNGYFHITTCRKAWGTGIVDDAGVTAINHIFDTNPDLLRVSCYIFNNNSPAKALARRVGFKREGLLPKMLMSGGEPRDIAHFGITRDEWNNLCLKPSPSLLQSDLAVVSSQELEAPVNNESNDSLVLKDKQDQ